MHSMFQLLIVMILPFVSYLTGVRNTDGIQQEAGYVAKQPLSSGREGRGIFLRHLAGAPYINADDEEDNSTGNSQDGHGEEGERNCTPPSKLCFFTR